MKIADLKPGIYRGNYYYYEITELDVRRWGDVPRDATQRWSGYYDYSTKVVGVFMCSLRYDAEGNARLTSYDDDERKLRFTWVTPGSLRTYLGSREEFLQHATAEQKERIALALAREDHANACHELAERLAAVLGVESCDVYTGRTVFHADLGIHLNRGAAEKLLSVLESLEEDISHLHEVHD